MNRMAEIEIYQVDAFAEALFRGNPAAVCPLEAWLPDSVMQSVAAENNLSETAFMVPAGEGRYGLRWFTPQVEIALCGHATLAAAYVAFRHLGAEGERVEFETMSGVLGVERRGELLELDFPSYSMERDEDAKALEALRRGLGAEPLLLMRDAHFQMARVADAATVRGLQPDAAALEAAGLGLLIVTAAGDEAGVDFVSRVFAPAAGIREDPVTGSAHCRLAPYWAAELGRNVLEARQVSARGGALRCEVQGERVRIAGRVVPYLEGRISVPL